MSVTLYIGMHAYTKVEGIFHCPEEGCEDGIVACKHEGQWAYWDDGSMYVLDPALSIVAPWVDWIQKMENKANKT